MCDIFLGLVGRGGGFHREGAKGAKGAKKRSEERQIYRRDAEGAEKAQRGGPGVGRGAVEGEVSVEHGDTEGTEEHGDLKRRREAGVCLPCLVSLCLCVSVATFFLGAPEKRGSFDFASR